MSLDTRTDASTAAASAGPLPAGTPAPDFTLPSGIDEQLRLSDHRGHPVILVFYPADWSPVCGDEVTILNEVLPELQRFGAELFGISVDGVWCHRAYRENKRLRFPLLSDFEPKGEVSRAYRSYHTPGGFSERTQFVIDGDGVIRWSYLSPLNVNPGADGILTALETLPSPVSHTGA